MKLQTLEVTQRLPVAIGELWDFVSSPQNLKTITPGYMGFDIVTDLGDTRMYPGMLIEYTVRPFMGIPVQWITEITHVREPFYFVDEQRYGPYKFWQHKHYLESIENGVEMKDVVDYILPYGILGEIAHRAFVRKQLQEIFSYRSNTLDRLFGSRTRRKPAPVI